MSTLSFLWSQLFVSIPLPSYDFSNQTIIITGSNRGIGLEAARHLLRLNVKTVILAVRSVEKGYDALRDLEASTGRTGAVLVEELDMSSHDSVKAFAGRMKTLPALDAVLLNAGIFTHKFSKADGFESHLTVNVINTFYLAFLLLPILKPSTESRSTYVRISFVSSDRHVMFNLPQWKEDNIFEMLSDEQTANLHQRYMISKLMQILLAREMTTRIQRPDVIINSFTPGYCDSGLIEAIEGPTRVVLNLLKNTTARTTEVGGRALVAAIVPCPDSHGRYLNDCRIDDMALSPFVRSTEGAQAQIKLWENLLEILERVDSNISLRVYGSGTED